MNVIEVFADSIEYRSKLQDELANMKYILYYTEKSKSTTARLSIQDRDCVILTSTWNKIKILLEADIVKLEDELKLFNSRLQAPALVDALVPLTDMYTKM